MKRLLTLICITVLLLLCACIGQKEAEITPSAVPEPVPTAVGEDELVLVTPEPTPTPEPPTPTPEPTPSPTPEPTPEPDGLIGWTEGGFVPKEETVVGETEYIGENLHFTVTTVVDNELFGHRLTYYVTDIYLRDIHSLRTAAANSFKSKNRDRDRDTVANIAQRSNALLAISGDMYNAHSHQLVIRNGVVYDSKLYSNWEVCFLYLDGTMETMTAEEYKSATLRDDIWQAWQFGPSLLDKDGHALTKFPTSQVKPLNPRCAIGYYEPGHYCFVTVDGRQSHSRGLELFELSKLMEMLGCKIAYNLDGGESASLYWNGGIYSKPCNGGRFMADIVYLVDGDPEPNS
ncbi:MAG: phosphodiester glycosidase family protein [Clostridia bacterium]|nr:phosphodiester glycosidase family protein [Clostridia bacterium]